MAILPKFGTIAAMDTVSSREVYANPWMTIREDAIRRQDGTAGIYGVVDKPDYALVIPLDGDRLHLVEQYRYPLGLRRWEFPQGTAPDRADLPGTALAQRELREETGLRAGSLVHIGRLDVAPGMSSQRGRVYLATDLVAGEVEREHEEQDMRAGWFSRAEFEAMIAEGTVTDAQSIAAYALLLLHERTTRSSPVRPE
ncbi:8-oxo-dGTP pyrophosphatase MutT (NUDIX family) [Actinoalloteichus hymeniacidonis]|uniref:NTP pyrophosphohydrolase n=2 Tax=Actinoalloteichus hymeniacidonis TaxID=340345 RepID=A0AAC9HN88_9PSEU|nr:NTP pyrophosphohydrolase [Actinoalloteichus hymeniacidonis]MBB5909676.1 8-oxo-dGTP pyrophosphatase MutT (NUDIX family) [Actinoalloteichus hymeniacidonis]